MSSHEGAPAGRPLVAYLQRINIRYFSDESIPSHLECPNTANCGWDGAANVAGCRITHAHFFFDDA